MNDLISRQAAIDAIVNTPSEVQNKNIPLVNQYDGATFRQIEILGIIEALPSALPKKEIAKRVLWTGWKGYRNTRYKCPNCKKPVKNDDIYCHRCGQKLMFPHISFTDYIPGEKQELIVRWDDE